MTQGTGIEHATYEIWEGPGQIQEVLYDKEGDVAKCRLNMYTLKHHHLMGRVAHIPQELMLDELFDGVTWLVDVKGIRQSYITEDFSTIHIDVITEITRSAMYDDFLE